MPVASMTGFARAEGSFGADTWIWEVKSVNSRGLDIRCRLAPGLDSLEPEARRAIAKRFKRGNVSVNLRVKRAEGTTEPRLNRDLFDALATARRDEGGHILPSIETLLAEIAELVEQARDCAATQPEALKTRLKDLLDELLDAQTGLSEERLAHEAALLFAKADIRE